MFENLNQPYPFNNNFKHNLKTISLVSMGFMLIVLYFQPFGINFLASARNGYFVLAIGLISAAVFFLNTSILPGLFTRLFEPSHWTLRKELIWNAGMYLFLISGFTLAALVFRISNPLSLTLFHSGALALLPLILFNLVNYNHSLKTKVVHLIDSGRHWLSDEKKNVSPDASETIRIVSSSGKELFEKQLANIILIQSSSNYIEVFYREGGETRKQLIRQTLGSVENQLSENRDFQKCHRCCMVNISQVYRMAGTSPNFFLEIKGLSFTIPVSRQHVARFRKIIIKE